MKTTFIAALSVATALSSAAVAHAGNDHYQFLSPTGNIACTMDSSGPAYAVCKVREHVWPTPATGSCELASVPGTTGKPGADLQLAEGDRPCLGSNIGQVFFDGTDAPASLDYGRSYIAGTITCGTEPSGVTCTDARTGHYFRVSRESYELG